MTVTEVMEYLESKGSEQIKKIYKNHGAPDNFFGVKVGDLKPIQKKVKKNQSLALELFDTGNSDAQYLAGLIADPTLFDKITFEDWIKKSSWYMLLDYAVAWNVAENEHCIDFCQEWIKSDDPKKQECAWSSLASYFTISPNEFIDVELHKSLVEFVIENIHHSENRVRHSMNAYVIAFGSCDNNLAEFCKEAGERIGKVDVFMGDTSCKTPDILEYLNKVQTAGRIGKKKKTTKC
jgi:3-methyladenine DNA glycosylase AlkD